MDDYSNLYSYPNKLVITSKNNKYIQLDKINSENKKPKEGEEEKDLLNHFKMNNDKENNMNNNNELNNNENNENKSEIINFNQFKNLHAENRVRKDSLISNHSNYGNVYNNYFVDYNLFNNILGYNFLGICLNKNENEVY